MADTNPPYYEWENFKLKATTPDEFIATLGSFGITTDAKFEAVDLTVNYQAASGTKTTTQKGFKVTTAGSLTIPTSWTNSHIKDFVGLKLYEVENNVSQYQSLEKKEQVTESAPYTTSLTYHIDQSGNGSADKTINISGLMPNNYTVAGVAITISDHGSYFTTYSSTCSWSGTTLTIHFYGEGGSTATTSVTETITYTIYVTSNPPKFFQTDKTYLLAGAELVTTHSGYFMAEAADFLAQVNQKSLSYDKISTQSQILQQVTIPQGTIYTYPKYGVKNRGIRSVGDLNITNSQNYFKTQSQITPFTIDNPKQWGFKEWVNGSMWFYSDFESTNVNNLSTQDITIRLDKENWLWFNGTRCWQVPPHKSVYLIRQSNVYTKNNSKYLIFNWITPRDTSSDQIINNGIRFQVKDASPVFTINPTESTGLSIDLTEKYPAIWKLNVSPTLVLSRDLSNTNLSTWIASGYLSYTSKQPWTITTHTSTLLYNPAPPSFFQEGVPIYATAKPVVIYAPWGVSELNEPYQYWQNPLQWKLTINSYISYNNTNKKPLTIDNNSSADEYSLYQKDSVAVDGRGNTHTSRYRGLKWLHTVPTHSLMSFDIDLINDQYSSYWSYEQGATWYYTVSAHCYLQPSPARYLYAIYISD